MTRLIELLRFIIFIGPLAFLIGTILALAGGLSGHQITIFIGLCFVSSGLIIWGCHGLRRRGRRPKFITMLVLGSGILLLHLNYRLSDLRLARINSMDIGSIPAVTTHLESRITLIICVLIASAVIGLLPPLPRVDSSSPPPLR